MLSLAMRDVPSARSPSLPQLVCRESAIMICERVCTGYLAGARDPRGRLRMVEILSALVMSVSVTGMWKTC
jgi:hypothetical protein